MIMRTIRAQGHLVESNPEAALEVGLITTGHARLTSSDIVGGVRLIMPSCPAYDAIQRRIGKHGEDRAFHAFL